jgi:transposase
MAQISYIKDLYENEGLSLREIARRTGKDFRTVRKYAYQENWNPPIKQLMPKEFPVMGKYIPVVNDWLEQDEKEPRKQRHTGVRIYERLKVEQGYTGSYGSVKRYVGLRRAEMKKYSESFLPLSHPPGYAQIDFGEFKYYDEAKNSHKGYALTVSLPYSNAGFTQVFKSQNQECLLEGLKQIFYYIGGVPLRVKCDNMTTAVAQILESNERILSDGFHRFMLHYRFGADFCNPAKGNEKGSVENKVGYTRRNMLVPVPIITDFAVFNEELLRRCDADQNRKHYQKDAQICELWQEEKSQLLALPKYEYDVFRYESLSVNKYGFVVIDTVRYGISPEFHRENVQAKIYFNKVEVYHKHILIKVFERSYIKNDEIFDWKTYLPALIKKPGAVPYTKFFDQMPKLWQSYIRNTEGKERKTALKLLSEYYAKNRPRVR